MIRRPPRSTQSRSSAASDVYKRQDTRYGMKRGIAGVSRLYLPGGKPNCLENAFVKPSWESKTKSNATSVTLLLPSRRIKAAFESRSALMYSNGDFPVSSLKIRSQCHCEYPAVPA